MIEAYEQGLRELAAYVWAHPEAGFREYKSAEAEIRFLEDAGFTVTRNLVDTGTGYMASWGQGKPVIAILGEFDALHGLSQKADSTRAEAEPHMEMGHGCGHHLLGVGAIAAGLMLREIIMEKGLSATVRVYGCPAEESGSGKAYMARDGVFDDCDAALTWHPDNFNLVSTGSTLSCIQCYFRFRGVSAHASGAPHLGRSALDAVELMNVGVNYLREHMEDSDRVHYAVTNAGGQSPNVVQAFAETKYLVRSVNNVKCEKLYERVKRIAQGAALMTDTELEIVFDEGLSNTVPSFTLEEVMGEVFASLGAPHYTQEERAYAQRFKDTFQLEDQLSDLPGEAKDVPALVRNVRESALCDMVVPTCHSERCSMGSTDVGDVSWVVPTVTAQVNCFSYGAGGHSWQWVAQGKSSIAMKGMLHAGLLLAKTAERLIEEPALLERAREELKGRLGGESYRCLIPREVKPHSFE